MKPKTMKTLDDETFWKVYFFDQITDRVADWAWADRMECGCDHARTANDLDAFHDILDTMRDYFKHVHEDGDPEEYLCEIGACPYAE